MRIGLNTGLVVVGKIGDDLRMDYTAVGDTTNLAARLQQLARPGSVVVSEATHRIVSGFFETLDLGEKEVKGHATVRAFEVLRARGRKALGELYERKDELAQARSAYASAIEVIEEMVGQLQDQGLKRIFLSARPVQEIRESLERVKG
jgi:hypothetical protein